MPENPYESPGQGVPNQPLPPDVVTPSVVDESDALSTVIPYKNKASLIAYYSGVFSVSACLPNIGVIGIALAIVAIVFGVKGLRYAREHPEARGRVHCWIGIIGGLVCLLPGVFMQITAVFAIIAAIMGK